MPLVTVGAVPVMITRSSEPNWLPLCVNWTVLLPTRVMLGVRSSVPRPITPRTTWIWFVPWLAVMAPTVSTTSTAGLP